jgi:toxin ParE1/3/4
MKPVLILPGAKDNLRDIYAYGVETWGVAQADDYYGDLCAKIDLIGEQPYMYPTVDYIRPGYRRSVYGGHSIYYRIGEDVVEIVAVLGSQDTDTAL